MPELKLGFDIIRSYKRLSYEPWSALAELVDNSTQSYFNDRSALDSAFEAEESSLRVDISYDRAGGRIVVADNAMGMNEADLTRALIVGAPPPEVSGRSRYGMGLKTAACWLGDYWTVRTSRLGSTEEMFVTVDVNEVANGNNDLPLVTSEVEADAHYTVIEITRLNRALHGRTLGKIREYLASMYRQDLAGGMLTLTWQGQELTWADLDDTLQVDVGGRKIKTTFDFMVGHKRTHGWAGVLERGSRAKAGFSILHAGRVIKGWPESWRPQTIYGQVQGSNNLVNQRLVGEIHLDDFEVTHTKDDILWEGTEQEQAEAALRAEIAELIEIASRPRGKRQKPPSRTATVEAATLLAAEVHARDPLPRIRLDDVAIQTQKTAALEPALRRLERTPPDFSLSVGDASVRGYSSTDFLAEDPHVVVRLREDQLVIVVNLHHPSAPEGLEGTTVLNHLRQCVFDGLVAWTLDPAGQDGARTLLAVKDQLLRRWASAADEQGTS